MTDRPLFETPAQDLARWSVPRRAARGALPPLAGDGLAERDPVASVIVDVPLPHLDRPFEYAVPAALADLARPGVRVKVRFSGQDVDGFVVARSAAAEHPGRLTELRRVVGGEVVLSPALLALTQRIAERYAGTLADVLRLAIPPRHAGAEKALAARRVRAAERAPGESASEGTPGQGRPGQGRPGEGTPGQSDAPARNSAAAIDGGPWTAYPAGPSFLRRIEAGQAPAAAWTALPGRGADEDWPRAFAVAAAAALAGGRGALLIVPDLRDVERVDAALTQVLADAPVPGAGGHARLTADLGPQARYSTWLRIRDGDVRCVIGTRSAAFAPVADLGLVAWWDDGDDLHQEPRAPYPHTREILLAQAQTAGAALLTGGYARSVAVADLVARGVLKPIVAEPAVRRAAAPRVRIAGEHDVVRDGVAARAHLPSLGWRAAQAALRQGPVLVQVPRRGYVPSLACQGCRRPARCPHCHGSLAQDAPGAAPSCRWCGRAPTGFRCPDCGDHRLRSSVVGARRTAEELGRAFPDVPVITSGSGVVVARVDADPALVIATPGAEPVPESGYAAALLLDAWAFLDRPALAAGEEALRRWCAAAALVRPGGEVILAGVPEHATLPEVEALVRWAPEWFADRELAERAALNLPPTAWLAELTGPAAMVREAVAGLADVPLPVSTEILGPAPVPAPEDRARVILRVPREDATALSEGMRALRAVRSARKQDGGLLIRVGDRVGDALG